MRGPRVIHVSDTYCDELHTFLLSNYNYGRSNDGVNNDDYLDNMGVRYSKSLIRCAYCSVIYISILDKQPPKLGQRRSQ